MKCYNKPIFPRHVLTGKSVDASAPATEQPHHRPRGVPRRGSWRPCANRISRRRRSLERKCDRVHRHREGAAGPADIAIMGSVGEVQDRVAALADIGVTDFAAVEFGATPEEIANTRDAIKGLLK